MTFTVIFQPAHALYNGYRQWQFAKLRDAHAFVQRADIPGHYTIVAENGDEISVSVKGPYRLANA